MLKKISTMISIFSLLLIFSFSIQASDVIQFPDSDLKVALLRQLGKSPNDEISIAEAENAPQTLDLSQAGISNLEGIQYFKNVTWHSHLIQSGFATEATRIVSQRTA